MKIAMFTNTYLPQVGGVAHSVESFRQAYRERGHEVIVIAPEYAQQPCVEDGVMRIPALQNFNGSDFSVVLPVPAGLRRALDDFQPEVIHSHHPYLIGNTALRQAAERRLPIVFTHHTMYEHYTHYVPLDSPALRKFVIALSTRYANLCDAVVAPSKSIAVVLAERGVSVPITVIPTGVKLSAFTSGDGSRLRRELCVPATAFVVGHVGRLAPEKNLVFLARAVATFLRSTSDGHFFVVGQGESRHAMADIFREAGMPERIHFTGTLTGAQLVDAYHAMDVFAFASLSETQGLVLVEALASGCPVVAIDAPGTREVVRDRYNGRLLQERDEAAFGAALQWVKDSLRRDKERLWCQSQASVLPFSIEACADRTLQLYMAVIAAERHEIDLEAAGWSAILRSMRVNWELWANSISALTEALKP